MNHRCIEALRAGIRRFECDECGYKWDETSRDALSPSGEHCPECVGHTAPQLGYVVKGVYFNSRGGVVHAEVMARHAEQFPDRELKIVY